MIHSLLTLLTLLTTSGPLLDSSGIGKAPLNGPSYSDSPLAGYHNPALLTFQPRAIHFGYLYMNQRLSITLGGRDSSLNIDESIFRAREYLPDGTTQALTTHPLPTSYLSRRGSHSPSQQVHYLAIALSQPIIAKRLSLGAVILLPVTHMQQQTPFFVDEREQYFSNSLHYELYEDRYQTQTISGGLGFSPLENLSLGLGAVMSMATRAVSALYMPDATEQDNFHIAPSVEIAPALNLYFGAAWRPASRWTTTLSIRLPEKMTTTMKTKMSFFMDEETGLAGEGEEFTLVYGYLPLRATLGAHYASDRWESAVTLGYQRWSQYINRMGERPYIPWYDTLSIAAHGSLRSPLGTLGVDVKYQPSPVPDQPGRDNYVDADRLSLALAISHPFTLLGRKMALTLTMQYHHLVSRSISKNLLRAGAVFDEYPLSADAESGNIIPTSVGLQTNNPGYPGYSHEGGIFAGSIMLTLY